MGGEAQVVWRRFVKRDEEIEEGELGAQRRRQEREARRIWKRYRRCMWWVCNSNPMLPGALEELDEPRIWEPQDLTDFLEEIKRTFRQLSSEYVMKLETFRPKFAGVETIYSNFNDISEVVEGTRAYTLSMLVNNFHSYLPLKIQQLMEARFMEEGMRRVREDEEPMSREEIRVMIDRLNSAKIFTKIDLRNVYHQVRVKEGHEWKTAFRCREGHFEYLVCPQGCNNAPAMFQFFMNDILQEHLDMTAIGVLDDVILNTDNTANESHTQNKA